MTYISVDIDLSDYKDECIEVLDDLGYLIYEDSSDIDTELMIHELNHRDYIVTKNTEYVFPDDNPDIDIKREICDFLHISYHTKKEDILKLLGEKFRE